MTAEPEMRATLEVLRGRCHSLRELADSYEERYWDLESLYERTYPVHGPRTYQQHRHNENWVALNAALRETYVESVAGMLTDNPVFKRVKHD